MTKSSSLAKLFSLVKMVAEAVAVALILMELDLVLHCLDLDVSRTLKMKISFS